MNIKELIEVANIAPKLINDKRRSYFSKAIKKENIDEYLKQDWNIEPSKLKKSVRIVKSKTHDVALEDRVWALFAKMKFEYLNPDRSFVIEYKKGLTKQIDVLACDKEAVLVVECKSAEKHSKKSLRKDINEFIGLMDPIRIKCQELLPGDQKISFLFVTNNIVLGDSDKARLREGNIKHLNQDDIDYFEQLVDHLGFAAKFQLFGKLFAGQKIPELPNRIPAIKGKISKGTPFYFFAIEPIILLKMAYILHRSETNSETSAAYQRLVKKKRLDDISKYINSGGYFPNSIIINISESKKLKWEQSKLADNDSHAQAGILHLPKLYRSSFIIDGQHRLYGYAKADFSVRHLIPVVAFHNMAHEEQTKIFVDINHTQKSVPANLLKSIMADFNWNSKDKGAALNALKARIVMDMNADEGSPLYKRVVVSEEKKTEERCLTLQTLLSWGLSPRTNFFGRIKGKEMVSVGSLSDVNWDNTLKKAVAFFNQTFEFVKAKSFEQWSTGSGTGGFIGMNLGVAAVMRVQDSILNHLIKSRDLQCENYSGGDLAELTFDYLDQVMRYINNLDNNQLKELRSLFGAGSVEKVLREFQHAIHLEEISFIPSGLEEWIENQSGVYNEPAYNLGHKIIEPGIHKFILDGLKEAYKEEWWKLGISLNVRRKCQSRKEEDNPDGEAWEFLDLIDYSEIILYKNQRKNNWEIFGKYFTPPEATGKNKQRLSWIAHFNDIRKKYSHPQREPITKDEFTYLENLKNWLSATGVLNT